METSVLEGVRHGSTRSGARSADAVATASVRSGLLEVDGAIDQRAGPGEEGQDLGDASQGDAEDACRARWVGGMPAAAPCAPPGAVASPQWRPRGTLTASTLGG